MTASFLSILSGVFSAVIGIGYRIGSKGKVYPIQAALLLDAAGIIIFSSLGKWQYDLPASVWLCGIIAGLTQYAAIRLLREALQRGPLSPAWCAIGLSFIPVLIYCWFFRGETPTVWQILSVCATVGAIVAASIGNAKAAGNGQKLENKKAALIYGILLISILFSSSVIYIILKAASYIRYNDMTLLGCFGNQIMTITYLFLMLPSVFDLSLSNTWQFNKYFWFGGLLVAVGGIGSFGIQLLIMNAPAVVVFALSGVTSLLAASLTSVYVFHEKRTVYWYVTVLLAVAAILCNR